jgi:hypothetical protein
VSSFDFITDEGLRESLQADYDELVVSVNNGAWKAVHVLAGSIIEALLVDSLLATRTPGAKGKDPLKMDLSDLISECRTAGLLSESTEQLSTVVRNYRNLIHPGRLMRLRETVNESKAEVAKALVDIIVAEVVAKRRETYGYTAEQVMDKVENDPSALAILAHLLKDMNPVEFERLLVCVFPPRYFRYIAQLPDYWEPSREPSPAELALDRTISSLEQCFTLVYSIAPDAVKAKAAQDFVRILREESEANVLAYEAACFRCSELKYLTDEDAKIVKTHVLSRFTGRQSRETISTVMRVIDGIGPYLTASEGADLAQAISMTISRQPTWRLRDMPGGTGLAILGEYDAMAHVAQSEFDRRWDQWIHSAAATNQPEVVEVLENLRNWWRPGSGGGDE